MYTPDGYVEMFLAEKVSMARLAKVYTSDGLTIKFGYARVFPAEEMRLRRQKKYTSRKV